MSTTAIFWDYNQVKVSKEEIEANLPPSVTIKRLYADQETVIPGYDYFKSYKLITDLFSFAWDSQTHIILVANHSEYGYPVSKLHEKNVKITVLYQNTDLKPLFQPISTQAILITNKIARIFIKNVPKQANLQELVQALQQHGTTVLEARTESTPNSQMPFRFARARVMNADSLFQHTITLDGRPLTIKYDEYPPKSYKDSSKFYYQHTLLVCKNVPCLKMEDILSHLERFSKINRAQKIPRNTTTTTHCCCVVVDAVDPEKLVNATIVMDHRTISIDYYEGNNTFEWSSTETTTTKAAGVSNNNNNNNPVTILMDCIKNRKEIWVNSGQAGADFLKESKLEKDDFKAARLQAVQEGLLLIGRKNRLTGDFEVSNGAAAGKHQSSETYLSVSEKGVNAESTISNEQAMKVFLKIISTQSTEWTNAGVIGNAFMSKLGRDSKDIFKEIRAKAVDEGLIDVGRRNLETREMECMGLAWEKSGAKTLSNETYLRITPHGHTHLKANGSSNGKSTKVEATKTRAVDLDSLEILSLLDCIKEYGKEWANGGNIGVSFMRGRLEKEAKKEALKSARRIAHENGFIEIGRRDLKSGEIVPHIYGSSTTNLSLEIYLRVTPLGNSHLDRLVNERHANLTVEDADDQFICDPWIREGMSQVDGSTKDPKDSNHVCEKQSNSYHRLESVSKTSMEVRSFLSCVKDIDAEWVHEDECSRSVLSDLLEYDLPEDVFNQVRELARKEGFVDVGHKNFVSDEIILTIGDVLQGHSHEMYFRISLKGYMHLQSLQDSANTTRATNGFPLGSNGLSADNGHAPAQVSFESMEDDSPSFLKSIASDMSVSNTANDAVTIRSNEMKLFLDCLLNPIEPWITEDMLSAYYRMSGGSVLSQVTSLSLQEVFVEKGRKSAVSGLIIPQNQLIPSSDLSKEVYFRLTPFGQMHLGTL